MGRGGIGASCLLRGDGGVAAGWLAGWKVGLLVQVTLLSVVDDALAPSTSTSIVLLRYLSIRNPFFYPSHTYVYQVPTKQQTKTKMIIL
jgi:hypothetical protein